MFPQIKKTTVKSIVKDIYHITQTEELITLETGEEITVQDLQHLIFQEIDQLADLLGIDLDEE